jgi:nicotinate dehydrogenase subunit B
MTPVVDALHKQNEIDVFAIAAYVGTLRTGERPIDADAVRTAALKLEWGHPDAPPIPKEFSEGAKVFEARCAQCHRHNGATVPLALQTSVHAPVPDNLVHAIRDGINPPRGALGRSMPAYGSELSEAEMSALVRFLRARFRLRASG